MIGVTLTVRVEVKEGFTSKNSSLLGSLLNIANIEE